MSIPTVKPDLLTCCRPFYKPTFCYIIEPPRFINTSFYPIESVTSQNVEHGSHNRLPDHNLNTFNSCTDWRAWSNDPESRRQHFLDITSVLVPLCGPRILRGLGENVERLDQREVLVDTEHDELKEEKQPDLLINLEEPHSSYTQNEVPVQDNLLEESPLTLEHKNGEEKLPKNLLERNSQDEILEDIDKTNIKEEQLSDLVKRGARAGHRQGISETLSKEEVQDTFGEVEEDKLHVIDGYKEEKKLESQQQDLYLLTDDLIDKLEIDLENLEETFDKFIKKNRDFIQNLDQLLNFEKQKQNLLEEEYNRLKQENCILQTENDYLKMLNRKQEDSFRNELDKERRENKAIYVKTIHQMEKQLKIEKEELTYYKRTEENYNQIVKNSSMEKERLNNEINELKNKEMMILKKYLRLLDFLREIKQMLGSRTSMKGIDFERSSNTMTDQVSPSLTQVLKTALRNGMQTLNVRDLSIMHDAIQDLNAHLCHQYGFCGRNSNPNVCVSHTSVTYTHLRMEEHQYPATSYMTGVQDNSNTSSLSFIPSKDNNLK